MNGTRVEILDFLDDHSRLLLTIQVAALWTSADVVTVMDQLISKYGPPAATLTDNGMVFTARFTAQPGTKNGFEKLLAAQSELTVGAIMRHHGLRAIRTTAWKQMTLVFLISARFETSQTRGDPNSSSDRHA